jgi:hypothetical protein
MRLISISARHALLAIVLALAALAGACAGADHNPVAPASAEATLTFGIDHDTCGDTPNTPMMDLYVDGQKVGTIRNMAGNSSVSVTVATGSHTVNALGDVEDYPPARVTVPATGLVITFRCG